MSFEVGAVYQNGSLKLDQVVPLQEGVRVRVTIEPEPTNPVERSYGMMQWKGPVEDIEYFAESPDLELGEGP
jgi:predicted DNA-binding antitoxin AbrB/MazE fold protein